MRTPETGQSGVPKKTVLHPAGAAQWPVITFRLATWLWRKRRGDVGTNRPGGYLGLGLYLDCFGLGRRYFRQHQRQETVLKGSFDVVDVNGHV